jgi:hypothetical protein
MDTLLAEVMRRRAALVTRAAAQREEVGRLTQQWQMPLALADHGIALVRTLRMHPLAVAVAVALLVRVRRVRLTVWIERIRTAWQFYHSLREHGARDRP